MGEQKKESRYRLFELFYNFQKFDNDNIHDQNGTGIGHFLRRPTRGILSVYLEFARLTQ